MDFFFALQSALLFSNGSNATYSDVANIISDLSSASRTDKVGLFPSDINTTNHVITDIIDFLTDTAAEPDGLLPFNDVGVCKSTSLVIILLSELLGTHQCFQQLTSRDQPWWLGANRNGKLENNTS